MFGSRKGPPESAEPRLLPHPAISTAAGLSKVCLYPYCSVNPNSAYSNISDLVGSHIPSIKRRSLSPPKDTNNMFNNRYLSNNELIPPHLRPQKETGPASRVDAPLNDTQKRLILEQTGQSVKLLDQLYSDTSGILVAKKPSNLVSAPRVNEKYECGGSGVINSGYYGGDIRNLATKNLVSGDPLAGLNSIFYGKPERPFSGSSLVLHKEIDHPLSHHRRAVQKTLNGLPYSSTLADMPLPLAGTFYEKDDYAALKAWNQGHKKPQILKYDPYLLSEGIQLRNSTLYKAPADGIRTIGHPTTTGGTKGSKGVKLNVRENKEESGKANLRAEKLEKAAREARDAGLPLRDITDSANKPYVQSHLADSKRRSETIKMPSVKESRSSPERHSVQEFVSPEGMYESEYQQELVPQNGQSPQKSAVDHRDALRNGQGVYKVLDPVCRKQGITEEEKMGTRRSTKSMRSQALMEQTPQSQKISPASVWRNTSLLQGKTLGMSTQQFVNSGPQQMSVSEKMRREGEETEEEFLEAAAQAESNPSASRSNKSKVRFADHTSYGAETVQQQLDEIKRDLKVVRDLSPTGAPLRDINEKGHAYTVPIQKLPQQQLQTIQEMEKEALQKRVSLERQGLIHPRDESYETQPQNLHQAYQDLERQISEIKQSLRIDGTSSSSQHPLQDMKSEGSGPIAAYAGSGHSAYRSSRVSRKSKTLLSEDQNLSFSMSEGGDEALSLLQSQEQQRQQQPSPNFEESQDQYLPPKF